jgi:hypothetical protein
MRLDLRKRLMGAKEDWTNGKPMEEQQQYFSRLKAVHSCLTFETPRKSMDTTVRDLILAGWDGSTGNARENGVTSLGALLHVVQIWNKWILNI